MDFEKLLTSAVERGASDLHLMPETPPVFRVHGQLEYQNDIEPLSRDYLDEVGRQFLSERRYGELRIGKEVDFAYMVRGVARFRVNMYLANGDVRAVLRVIPARMPKFEELHLPRVLEKLAMDRRGLILVTGVTGSGKSTTLAAMIDYMNRVRTDHIITIEDPIEFAHAPKKCIISQREMGHDSEGFGTARRSARIRISSWSARCGTPRPWRLPSTRPRRGIWCSPRSTR
jgi:twitching motility protein PilT